MSDDKTEQQESVDLHRIGRPLWRGIVGREWYTPLHARLNGAIKLTLDCGHETHRNASAAPKGGKLRCRECESVRRGQGSIYPTEHRQEIWDEATQMPVWREWPTLELRDDPKHGEPADEMPKPSPANRNAFAEARLLDALRKDVERDLVRARRWETHHHERGEKVDMKYYSGMIDALGMVTRHLERMEESASNNPSSATGSSSET